MNKQEILDIIEKEVISIWNSQEESPFTDSDWEACYLHRFSEKEKIENETALSDFLKKAQSNTLDFEGFIKKESFLCVEQYMGMDLFRDYLKNMCMFFSDVRQFDPEITFPQFWQALRNYLIYGMVLAMVGEKQTIHDSILSFSLLYPYTDNYIDSPKISAEAKVTFNNMIYQTLHGEDVAPLDALQKKTKTCVLSCRNYMEGTKVDEASELLLLMLDAQAHSSKFVGDNKDIDWDRVLRMLAYKGGMSVLIDYFYAVPKMKEIGIIFYLQFGLILQLADDIQDIKEDSLNGMRTLFSLVNSKKERESNTIRLMHFTKNVFAQYDAEDENMKQFMLRNCMVLYMFAIMKSESFYTKEFIDSIADYLPFRKEFARKLSKDMQVSEDMPKKTQDRLFMLLTKLCDN